MPASSGTRRRIALTAASPVAMAAALAALAAAPLGAQQIDTRPAGGGFTVFGGNQTELASVGQSFVVPAGLPSLAQFQFFADVTCCWPAELQFRAYVAAFDPALRRIVGPLLYASAAQAGGYTHGPDPFPLTFTTGGLALTPGAAYLALLSAADFPQSIALHEGGLLLGTTPYAGGSTQRTAAAFSLAELAAATWDDAGGAYDLAFTATFSQAHAVVPEPGTASLAAAGAALLGLARARGRRGRGT
jgi:hypothetical protein